MTSYAGHNDPRGRTPIDPAIFKLPGSHIIGMDGQSMPANSAALSYYGPSVGGGGGQVYELNINDGLIYKMDGWAVANMDGPAGRLSVLPYWGDMMVWSGKCQRILWVPLNIGGSHSARWCPGGDLYPRLVRAMELLHSLDLLPTYWVRQIGQTDAEIGTTAADFCAQNVFSVNCLRALGMAGTFIMGRGAYKIYTPPAHIDAILAGQAATAQALGQPMSANDDTIQDAPGWRVDGVHWADVGRYYTVNQWLPSFGNAP